MGVAVNLRIDDFEWLDWVVVKNWAKHGVEPEAVESALLNTDPEPYVMRIEDGKYRAWAQAEGDGDYLFVVFSMPQRCVVRIISARPMSDREKSKYRRSIGK